jgi:hypothetical protein
MTVFWRSAICSSARSTSCSTGSHETLVELAEALLDHLEPGRTSICATARRPGDTLLGAATELLSRLAIVFQLLAASARAWVTASSPCRLGERVCRC